MAKNVIPYGESDEPVLRRLGCAVVLEWEQMDTETRDRILHRATMVHDRVQTSHLRQEITAFIKDRQGGADAKGT